MCVCVRILCTRQVGLYNQIPLLVKNQPNIFQPLMWMWVHCCCPRITLNFLRHSFKCFTFKCHDLFWSIPAVPSWLKLDRQLWVIISSTVGENDKRLKPACSSIDKCTPYWGFNFRWCSQTSTLSSKNVGLCVTLISKRNHLASSFSTLPNKTGYNYVSIKGTKQVLTTITTKKPPMKTN